MPNYGLVVTPTYNPMSYEQYIAPFREYAQVFNDTADKIDALEMEANQWERLADSDIDAPQYQQFKNYADDLRTFANELATNGLSNRTRAGLSRMRQRYSKEIKPIEDAYNRRLEDIKAEDALLAKDPSLVLAQSARNIGLGQYMASTPQRYSVSGNDVYARSLAATKAITDAMALTPEEKTAFSGFYYDFVTRVGEPDAETAYEYIRNRGVDESKALQFSKYVDAINDILASTNYNQLTDEGKNRIYSYAVNGAITGIGYDEKHQLLRSPIYDLALKDREDSTTVTPAVTTPIIREMPKLEKKDAVKVREDLNNNRERIRNPWAEGTSRTLGDKTLGRFKEDSPVKRTFNTVTEAESWADAVIAQIDKFLKDTRNVPADDKYTKSIDIDGTTVKYADASKVYSEAKELKDRIAKYRESLAPYSRTLEITEDNFATDQQLAAIAAIQQNVGARQNITFNLQSLGAEDIKARKAKYDQIVNGVRNYEKGESRGLYEVDEKKNKLSKITSKKDYDDIVENGDLVYSTEYGMAIQSGDKLYVPKNNPEIDDFNKSNKAIIQALNFDDSLYKLDTNLLEDKSNAKIENLQIKGQDDKDYLNPNSVVYKDKNITIYEGLDNSNEVRRVIVDNVTHKVITSISLLEAATGEAFLAGGTYQEGINSWWRQALKLENIANDNI